MMLQGLVRHQCAHPACVDNAALAKERIASDWLDPPGAHSAAAACEHLRAMEDSAGHDDPANSSFRSSLAPAFRCSAFCDVLCAHSAHLEHMFAASSSTAFGSSPRHANGQDRDPDPTSGASQLLRRTLRNQYSMDADRSAAHLLCPPSILHFINANLIDDTAAHLLCPPSSIHCINTMVNPTELWPMSSPSSPGTGGAQRVKTSTLLWRASPCLRASSQTTLASDSVSSEDALACEQDWDRLLDSCSSLGCKSSPTWTLSSDAVSDHLTPRARLHLPPLQPGQVAVATSSSALATAQALIQPVARMWQPRRPSWGWCAQSTVQVRAACAHPSIHPSITMLTGTRTCSRCSGASFWNSALRIALYQWVSRMQCDLDASRRAEPEIKVMSVAAQNPHIVLSSECCVISTGHSEEHAAQRLTAQHALQGQGVHNTYMQAALATYQLHVHSMQLSDTIARLSRSQCHRKVHRAALQQHLLMKMRQAALQDKLSPGAKLVLDQQTQGLGSN
jgi:hypothetical protein